MNKNTIFISEFLNFSYMFLTKKTVLFNRSGQAGIKRNAFSETLLASLGRTTTRYWSIAGYMVLSFTCELYGKIRWMLSQVCINPVNAKRYLDVNLTSFERYGRQMDVKTFCAYWKELFFCFLIRSDIYRG